MDATQRGVGEDLSVDCEGGEGRDEERTVAVKMKDFEIETDRQVESKEVVPRNFYISVKNLEDHGFSSRCQGCLSILHGGARQAHSAARRKRFEIILSDSDRVKRAHKKIVEYLAKKVEMTEEEMAKKKVKVHETRVEKDGDGFERDGVDVESMRAQGETSPDLG